jgi:hypothetical protein
VEGRALKVAKPKLYSSLVCLMSIRCVENVKREGDAYPYLPIPGRDYRFACFVLLASTHFQPQQLAGYHNHSSAINGLLPVPVYFRINELCYADKQETIDFLKGCDAIQ